MIISDSRKSKEKRDNINIENIKEMREIRVDRSADA